MSAVCCHVSAVIALDSVMLCSSVLSLFGVIRGGTHWCVFHSFSEALCNILSCSSHMCFGCYSWMFQYPQRTHNSVSVWLIGLKLMSVINLWVSASEIIFCWSSRCSDEIFSYYYYLFNFILQKKKIFKVYMYKFRICRLNKRWQMKKQNIYHLNWQIIIIIIFL